MILGELDLGGFYYGGYKGWFFFFGFEIVRVLRDIVKVMVIGFFING